MKTTNIENILVPIDFSPISIQAIEVANRFARRFGATIHLAHVHQFLYPAGFTAPMPPVMPFAVADYEKDIEQKLVERLRELARKHGLSSRACHVCAGGPAYDELCHLAKEIPADLIVMPTHGHTGFKHLFLGSTAERIVQHSPCPVFVARQAKGASANGQTDPPVKNILVPVDFSGPSLEGLAYAVDFARKFGAKIIVQHAVDLGPIYMADNYGVYDLSNYREMVRVNATQQMREFVRLVNFGRVEFETVVTVGPAVWEICDLARNRNVDLIITSTHGRTGFKHVLIGSTAERVVRHAPCSVLVVPRHLKIRSDKLVRRSEGARKPRGRASGTKAAGSANQARKAVRKYRKRAAHPFPERRSTNRFRETHSKK